MRQIAAPIWNQISKEGMRTSLGKRLFHLSQDQLTERLQWEADWLERQGYDPTAILAVQLVGPLLQVLHLIEKQKCRLTAVRCFV